MTGLDFRQHVESGDIDGIAELLTEGVVFHSPTLQVPFVGREAVVGILHAVHETFRDFRYTDDVRGTDSIVLFFEASIGRERARGLDYLRLGHSGLIEEFQVYLGPLPALAALSQAMYPRLLRKGILQPASR